MAKVFSFFAHCFRLQNNGTYKWDKTHITEIYSDELEFNHQWELDKDNKNFYISGLTTKVIQGVYHDDIVKFLRIIKKTQDVSLMNKEDESLSDSYQYRYIEDGWKAIRTIDFSFIYDTKEMRQKDMEKIKKLLGDNLVVGTEKVKNKYRLFGEIFTNGNYIDDVNDFLNGKEVKLTSEWF